MIKPALTSRKGDETPDSNLKISMRSKVATSFEENALEDFFLPLVLGISNSIA
jgi:hypothetical protein